MKKVLTLAIFGTLFTLILASCGSSGDAGCDAYGSNQDVNKEDVASK